MSGTSDVPSCHDGDLLYLTETAYFALSDHESESGSKWSSKSNKRQDGLFLERLESFIEGQIRDMESFATREQRPLDEIRKLVAVPHARYILSLDPTLPQSDDASQASTSNIPSIRNTLARLSSTLQLLHNAAGLDSLLLVVSPGPAPSAAMDAESHQLHVLYDSYDASYIGGTDLGKEFWMGLKGGGLNGARAFRVKCQMRREAEARSLDLEISPPTTPSTISHLNHIRPSESEAIPLMKMKSGDVKTELYAAVRHALRSASGIPSAEMRWTKPASLEELYNVRLIGWPSSVEMRNPSNNSLKENRLLLDLIRNGKMRFVQKGGPASPTSTQHATPSSANEETIPWHTHSAASASEDYAAPSLHPAMAVSMDSPKVVESKEATQQSSRLSTLPAHGSFTRPHSFTPGRDEGIDVSTSSVMNYPQTIENLFFTSSPTVPKRPIEGDATQEHGSEAKRAKLGPRDSAG